MIDYFGGIKLTYGFASPALTALIIKGRIDPKLDQHAACETTAVAARSAHGAARPSTSSSSTKTCVKSRVDRRELRLRPHLLYGKDRPIHVSWGPEHSGEAYELTTKAGDACPASWPRQSSFQLLRPAVSTDVPSARTALGLTASSAGDPRT